MTSHPSWQLGPGDLLAPGLRVAERLGGGKRAEVYLVDRASGGSAVAKVARPAGTGGDSATPRDEPVEVNVRALRRESEAMATVDHPAFPALLDVALDGPRPLLLLEHVEGPRLSTLVRRFGPLAREQLSPLVTELAGGLAQLHERGWVHLDVKPANVVVGARPRLIDLGVARTLDAARRVRGRVGTARWMSPEQHHPAEFDGIGPAADVWGLAVCLHFSLTGAGPLDEVRERDRAAFAPTREDVGSIDLDRLPPSYRGAVGPCLSWEPGARPDALELSGFVAGTTSARRSSPPRPRRWRRGGARRR